MFTNLDQYSGYDMGTVVARTGIQRILLSDLLNA